MERKNQAIQFHQSLPVEISKVRMVAFYLFRRTIDTHLHEGLVHGDARKFRIDKNDTALQVAA